MAKIVDPYVGEKSDVAPAVLSTGEVCWQWGTEGMPGLIIWGDQRGEAGNFRTAVDVAAVDLAPAEWTLSPETPAHTELLARWCERNEYQRVCEPAK